MGQQKAVAGGMVAALTTVLMYFLDMVPAVKTAPADVHLALEFLISGGLVWAAVYFTSNKPKGAPHAEEKAHEG